MKVEIRQDSNGSFLKHAAVYGLGTLLLQAASFVLLPLYTGYLTPAEFGVLEILNRIGNVLVICLMVNGIRMATLTFYRQAENQRQRESTAATVVLGLMILLFGCGSLVIVFAGTLGTLIGIDDTVLLAFGVLAFLLESTTLIPLVLMQARLESGSYVCTTVAMLLCRITLAILAIAVLGWGIWGVFASTAVTAGTFGLVLTLRELAKGSFRPDFAKLREVARYALPFVPGGLCFFVLHSGDRFFLVRCAGTEEVGLYALGYKLVLAVGMFSTAPLMKVWSARMYDAFEGPEAPARVGRVFTGVLGAYLFVGMGLCLLKDEAVALLSPASFAAATAVVSPLVLAYYFLTAADLMDSAFYVRRRTGLKPWIAATSTLVMLALYAWWIPPFGAMGAARATLVGFLFHAALTWGVSQRVFRVQYQTRRLAVMLGLAIALTLASRGLGTGIGAVVGKLALWALWPTLLWSWKIVSEDEKAWAADTARNILGRLRFLPTRGRAESDA